LYRIRLRAMKFFAMARQCGSRGVLERARVARGFGRFRASPHASETNDISLGGLPPKGVLEVKESGHDRRPDVLGGFRVLEA
jgi:hypothetical protein